MAKSHQTFRKRQRERSLREKAQRKRERREQRRHQKKEPQVVVPEPFPGTVIPTEVDPAAGYQPEDEPQPTTNN